MRLFPAPTRAAILRGAYGPYRANNDLLLLPTGHSRRSGEAVHQRQEHHPLQNAQDGTRIQLDLRETFNIDKILMGATPLKYERDSGASS